RTAAEVFGGEVPCRSYTFLFHVLEGAGGGLEHRDSCVCGFPPFAFRPKRSYQRQLSLISHEYFHTWNVKRIRPAELGPFDYGAENYTRLLWVSEGFTSYYDGLILRRAGLTSVPVFLDGLARMIRTLGETPGHAVDSVEQSSFDAWIKLYRPHENLRNMTVSYYLKGALVALLIDLTIRDATDGAKSLDDVLRALWAGYRARPERGFTESELMEALAGAAGRSLEPEIGAWVKGTGPLPFEETLARVGLALVPSDGSGPSRPWLGIVPGEGGKVKEVLDGSPARAAGLNAGDELIALDGFRLGDLSERLAEKQAADRVVFTVCRRGRLREIPVVLGGDPGFDRALRPREGAGEREERLFTGWLGEPLSAAKESAGPPPKEPAPRPI
ncbi:MAG: PDZ domain-containing protein, partial [Planctomycetes bacterium]|nr:PDZ domain-containing protein [Planctomycetota bacterium]